MKVSLLKARAGEMLNNYKQKDPASYAAAQQAIGGVLILDGLVGIENPFNSNKRPGIFGSLFGIAFGVIFMLIPTFFGNLTGSNNMTATTNGEVVSVSRNESSSDSDTCSVVARYTVDSKEYTQRSSSGSSGACGFTEGQTITVNYNPAQPGAWMSDVKTLNMLLSVFFFAGLLVVITSVVTFVIRLLSIIFGWKLLRSGRALAATLPEGANIAGLVGQMKEQFIGMVRGNAQPGLPQIAQPSSGSAVTPVVPVQPLQAVPAATPPTPAAPSSSAQDVQQTPSPGSATDDTPGPDVKNS